MAARGQLALARSAATEAVHHFSTAVALVEGSPEVNPATLLGLQLPLAGAYSMQLGLGAPETGAAFERARELCSEVGRTPELAPALFGLWRYFVVRPAFDTCQSLCEELLALPGDDDPTLSVLGHYGLGFVCYNRGEFERACEHFDAALAQYNVKQRRHAYGAGQDSAVSCLSYRAWERWTSGYPERAKDDVGRAIELAQTIEHPFTLAFVHVVTGLLHVLLRDIEGVRTSAAEALSVCAQHGFPTVARVGHGAKRLRLRAHR